MHGWATALPVAWRPTLLGAPSSSSERALPSDWARQAGEYVGAWAAGGALGYLVARDARAAVRTGLATSSLRNLTDVVLHRADYPIWYLALLGVTGIGSLVYVWRAGAKRS